MKVCILGNQARSMSIFWRVLIATLIKDKFNVFCAAPTGDETSEQIFSQMGVKVYHYNLDRKGINPARDLFCFLNLKKLFMEHKPDILFATTIKPVIYGCIAAHYAHVPCICATITGLGYAFERDNLFKKIINRISVTLYRHSLAYANGIFFQNRDDEELFKIEGILPATARIFLVQGTGVDTEYFNSAPLPALPPKGRLTFLMVCRLLEAKGLREYAEAAARLRAKYPEARFELLGPYEHGRGSVSPQQIAAWQLENGIDYLGESTDVRPYISASHVAVLPSWREGVPTSLMEAMSMGRPCVATDVPGCREVVKNGINGWLAQCCDPASLAQAMEKFLLNPASIADMGQKSREMAIKDFDAHKVARNIIDCIHSACPNCGKRPETGAAND